MAQDEDVLVLHRHALEGAEELVPGIYMGGLEAAAEAVKTGLVQAEEFRFFLGGHTWEGSRPLQAEVRTSLREDLLSLSGGAHLAGGGPPLARASTLDRY